MPAIFALAALTLLGGPLLLSAQMGEVLNGFLRTGDYLLDIEGEQVDAEIYRSGAPAILVVSNGLPAPVLIRPRSRSVELVGLLKMNKKPDGSIDLLPNPAYASAGVFQVSAGQNVVFNVEGKAVALKPNPPLVGFQDAAAMFQHSPEYAQRAEAYMPSPAAVETLRAQSQEVRVQVFFGSWCPACSQMVPRIIKVAEQCQGSKIDFAFYGLPRQFAGDAVAKQFAISSVPTGVVLVNGREVGRIKGNDWRIPEAAINSLLTAGS